MTYFPEIKTSYAQFGVDASARTRVSEMATLADLKTLNADRTLLIETNGTGTNTFAVNQNTMSVTSGQFLIRNSRRFFHYFSGKSQTMEFTFRQFQPEANVVKRVGYFSSNAVTPFNTNKDGFWLESDGTTIRLIISRLGTEVYNVPIASWSGYDDLAEYQSLPFWSNFSVLAVDYLWLGGAVLRLWVKTSNGFTLAHVVEYAGSAGADSVFIASPNQPIRYEIRSTTGAGTFVDVCSQIAVEGLTGQSGMSRSVNTGTTGIVLATIGTTYPLIAIRKQVAFRDIASEINNLQVFVSSTSDNLLWSLQVNPTLSAAFTYTAVANSSMEYSNGSGTVTSPGTIIASGIITSGSIVDNKILEDNFLSYLGSTLANVMDVYCLCGTPITSNITSFSQIGYKEY